MICNWFGIHQLLYQITGEYLPVPTAIGLGQLKTLYIIWDLRDARPVLVLHNRPEGLLVRYVGGGSGTKEGLIAMIRDAENTLASRDPFFLDLDNSQHTIVDALNVIQGYADQ